MAQKKLELIFSTKDKDGDMATERHVKHLIAGMAILHSIDGYTLNKALTGYWKGEEEDSYALAVISFTEYDYGEAMAFIIDVSKAVKVLYNQDETLLTETDITVL